MATATLYIKFENDKVAELYNTTPNLKGDAGFDLYLKDDVTFGPRESKIVPLGITCAMGMNPQNRHFYILLTVGLFLVGGYLRNMYMPIFGIVAIVISLIDLASDYENRWISYFIYPRSSISKTKLRLSNSVGVIDSGYRGELMLALDNISDQPVTVERGSRLAQIVIGADVKIKKINRVVGFATTTRGARGFGST
jgi:dUTP pyrophosphatase